MLIPSALLPQWDATNCTVSTAFELSAAVAGCENRQLVLDGVKMAAWVSLNGIQLGVVADQVHRAPLATCCRAAGVRMLG